MNTERTEVPSGRKDLTVKDRRSFLMTLASGFAGGFASAVAGLETVHKAVEIGPAVLKEINDEARVLWDRSGHTQYRIELIRKLFRISGFLHIPAPTNHPVHHRPGPHDIAAMAVPSLMYTNPLPVEGLRGASLSMIDTLFAVGSPVSSALSAIFIPSSGAAPNANSQLVIHPQGIPYHFLEGEESGMVVKSATENGRIRSARNHGLTSGTDAWHPAEMADFGRYLQTDFLLLTVLPWNRGGGHAVFACGGHGAGTHALKLLLDHRAFPIEDLVKLVADLQDAVAFQVVFEIPVSNKGIYTMPTGIRVSRDLPPKKISNVNSLMALPDDKMLEAVCSVVWNKVQRPAIRT